MRRLRVMSAGLLVLTGLGVPSLAIQTAYIDVNATVAATPTPQVTFTWDSQDTWAQVQIARRAMGVSGGTNTWDARAAVGYPTNTFTDAISAGTTYEYRVRRPYNAAYNTYREVSAYVAVALDAPLVDDRGGLLLVVDNTVTNALPGELRQLEMDLAGDGWTVQRLDFARDGAATPPTLRAAVSNAWTASGGSLKALYLFGHLPVASSGWIAPDGHSNLPQHADGFYGDMDGAWTDASRNVPGVNVTGDGIYDQDYFPSNLELMVGRVDMTILSYFHKREIEYLRDYAHKSHAFRHGRRTEVSRRGLWNSGYLWPERNWLNPLFGTANVTYTPFQPTLATAPHLFGIDFGSVDLADYIEKANKLIFGVNFGSGKLYWNNHNNMMRALLAQPDWGLTCVWGARPSWFFHHMGVGLPVGYSALRTMNNNYLLSGYATTRFDYFPTGDYYWMSGYVHESLMGDPTLRLHPVMPPEGVAVEKQGGAAVLTWQASPDAAVAGYHVYSSTNRLGPYARLTAAPHAALAYTNATPPPGTVYYQVRAVKREVTSAAVYTNASQGVFARLNADGAANRAPSVHGTNLATTAGQFLVMPLAGSDADGDALTPIVTRNPLNGELRRNGTEAVCVPKQGFSGSDSVEFVMSDGVTVSAPATISFDVGANRNLLEWEFTSPTNSAIPQVMASTSNAPGIKPAAVAFGPALSENNLYLFTDDAISVQGAAVGGLAANSYLEWAVTPESFHRMSLERVSLGLWNYDASRPVSAELRWSGDGFATWQTVPMGAPQVTLAEAGYGALQGMPFTGSLAGFSALQSRTNSATFRLYLWYATAPSYTGIGKLGLTYPDLMVSGTVISIHPPGITSPAQATGRVGEPFAYTITATNAPTGFGATGLPGWAAFDPGSGLISGVPTEAGVSHASITATNAYGAQTLPLDIVIGWTITASAGFGGSIAPSGVVAVAEGATQGFTVTAADYFTIADVQVDGISTGAVASYTFASVATNHTIAASFDALLTARGTPQWWLALCGWSNNFDAADLADTDGDAVPNWREYDDETQPTNALSRAPYNTVPYAESFENLAGWGGILTPTVYPHMGWQSSAPGADGSRIVHGEYAYAAPGRPLPLATHTNVLLFETGGSELASSFGPGHDMTGTVTYIDMMSQLVLHESTPVECTATDTGLKAAVYLNVSSNMVVYHGVAAADGTLVSNTTDATTLVLNPTNWHRITVAIDATAAEGSAVLAMFQVRANGIVVTNAAAYADGWKAHYATLGVLPATSATGTWFRLASANAAARRLTELAFSGNGYLDDVVVTLSDPFATAGLTYLLTVTRGSHGASSLGSAALVSVPVPAGCNTQIVYQANDWYRIAALAANGVIVPGAAGWRTYTQVLANVSANVSNDVAFAEATPAQTGHANVPTSWLMHWTEAAVAAGGGDGFDVEAKHMLGLDPTASNTYRLVVESLAATGSNVVTVVRRDVTGALSPDGMHGWLRLQVSTNLTAGFTNMPGTAVTDPGAFDPAGRRAYTNALPSPAAFHRAVITAEDN